MMLPRQAPHVSTKEIDGQTMILDRQHGKLHELNATASFIWQCCDGHTPISDIVSATARSFDVNPAVVEQDVMKTLQNLEKLRLIDWVPPPSRSLEAENGA